MLTNRHVVALRMCSSFVLKGFWGDLYEKDFAKNISFLMRLLGHAVFKVHEYDAPRLQDETQLRHQTFPQPLYFYTTL